MSLQYVIDGYNLINHRLFIPTDKRTKDSRIALLELIRIKKLCGSPANEVIVVTVTSTTAGPIFSDTISAGCFTQKEGKEKWTYKSEKQKCDTKIDSMTIDLGKSTFELKASKETLPRLPATMGDTENITIDIRVGNDRGLATNLFRVKKDKKTGIPVKLQFP